MFLGTQAGADEERDSKMQRYDILFATNRFNVSDPKPCFINECCFGDDLANWLRLKLIEKGIQVEEPYQEDWGWEMRATHPIGSYYLGVTGFQAEPAPDPNAGEWRIMVSKRRSLWQRLSGSNKMASDEEILDVIETVFLREPGFRVLGRE